MKKMLITIDGPAGAGKSTVSRVLANRLGLIYLDTGAMYRAVALKAIRKKIEINDEKALKSMCSDIVISFKSDEGVLKTFLDEEDVSAEIRKPEIDMSASSISAVKAVREAMTELQRKIGQKGSIVAEGRDMGTVVFPDADHKFFITASIEERAERRYRERVEKNEAADRKIIESDIQKRDQQDSSRALAPLKPAQDSIIIDTTDLNIDQVIDKMLLKIAGKSV